MRMHYSYPTTKYESILAQMNVFLVFFFTFFAFYHENDFKQKLQKYFSTRIVYIQVNILSYHVVKELYFIFM